MTGDELRAAAGRTCQRMADANDGVEFDRWPAADRDAYRVAVAYQMATPADDGEPVTADWLGSVGFHRPQQVVAGTLMVTHASITNDRWDRLPVLGVGFPLRRRPDEIPVWQVWVYGHARDLNHCPTRGEIRRLLAALGVTA